MATYTSASALKAAVRKKAQQAVTEIGNKGLEAASNNVQWFYAGGHPEYYQRTGAMGDSPHSETSGGGSSYLAKIYLDTSYEYDTGNWDTEKIFRVAEAGGLVGNGGFWTNTVDQVPDIIETAMKNEGFTKK